MCAMTLHIDDVTGAYVALVHVYSCYMCILAIDATYVPCILVYLKLLYVYICYMSLL